MLEIKAAAYLIISFSAMLRATTVSDSRKHAGKGG